MGEYVREFVAQVSKSSQYCFASSLQPHGLLVLCETALGKQRQLLGADYEAAANCKRDGEGAASNLQIASRTISLASTVAVFKACATLRLPSAAGQDSVYGVGRMCPNPNADFEVPSIVDGKPVRVCGGKSWNNSEAVEKVGWSFNRKQREGRCGSGLYLSGRSMAIQ